MEVKDGGYSIDKQLVATYLDIEKKAIDAIKAGKTDGNPLLKYPDLERCYSLCAQGLIYGSPAYGFLVTAIQKLKDTEPNLRFQPTQFLHFTLGEVVFADGHIQKTRKLTAVNAEVARIYHKVLTEQLSHYRSPIDVNLYRLFPALDPFIDGKQTSSLVAGFLTGGDQRIYRLRNDLRASVSVGGLGLSSRLGPIKVLFVTMGRFIDSPTNFGDKVPVLEALNDINETISENCRAQIDAVQLISTATRYLSSEGHVFIEPQISLSSLYRSREPIKFLRPWQKLATLP